MLDARPSRRGGGRADRRWSGSIRSGSAARPADAGAVPVRAAGRGADRVRRRPSRPRRGAWHRARAGAAGAARADPRGRSGPRSAPPAAERRASGSLAARDRPVPAQLPADVAAFTGPAAELAALDQLLAAVLGPADGAGQPGPRRRPSRSWRAPPGWARPRSRCAGRAGRAAFPDGQLYVNLRGYDPDAPVPPADALAGFLRALGLPGRTSRRGRRARRRLPQPARRPPDAGRARQRRQRGAGPPAAARQPVLPGGGDQP